MGRTENFSWLVDRLCGRHKTALVCGRHKSALANVYYMPVAKQTDFVVGELESYGLANRIIAPFFLVFFFFLN